METTQAPRQPDTSRSDTIGALAAALAKAQGAMSVAVKDKTNPAFGAKSRYADLAATWDACRSALAANGLAVVQQASTAPDGINVSVATTLIHSSGEWMRDRLTLPVEKKTIHGIGSAITYARRYALQAMVGIAPGDDDDGNGASAATEPPESGKKDAPRQASAREGKPPTRTEEIKAKLGLPLVATPEEKPGKWSRIVELGALYGLNPEQTEKYAAPFLQGRKKVTEADEIMIGDSLATTHKRIVGGGA